MCIFLRDFWIYAVGDYGSSKCIGVILLTGTNYLATSKFLTVSSKCMHVQAFSIEAHASVFGLIESRGTVGSCLWKHMNKLDFLELRKFQRAFS